MQFVKNTLESVAQFLKSEDIEIALAVAFWGGDALKRLGVAEWKAKNIRMICNATSGACNPRALKELRSHIGSNLRTNPNLHAKVYWTPSTLVITSANASASGLSLEGEEVKGNIEAGIVSTDHLLLTEVKQWFDELYDSHKTVEVDKNIIKEAKAMWDLRRPGRLTLEQFGDVTAALRDRAALEDRNIWVAYYEVEERSSEGEKQHKILNENWRNGRLRPPVVAGDEVVFDGVDDYEEISLAGYHWKSWIIDRTDGEPFSWFVPNKGSVIPLPKTKTFTVPLYRARRVRFGNQWMRVSRRDIPELKKRWKSTVGPKSDKWVRLQDLAD
jgi:hypothetical protein